MGLTIFYTLVKISKERLSTNGRFPLAMRAPPDIQVTAGAPKRAIYSIYYLKSAFKPNLPGFQGSMIQNSLNETSVSVGS